MKLVLVRHAKAVNRAVDMEVIRHGGITGMEHENDDYLRGLTEEGINEFRESINSIRDLLIHMEKPIIWSSSKVRADQTARIISETLNIDDISYFNFLANGDYEEFIKQLLMQARDNTIIAVGHEPFLSDWILRILGQEMTVKKGQIICINFEEKNLVSASLEWIKEPKREIEYYKVPNIKKGSFSTDIKNVAAYYTQRILLMRDNFIKSPEDVVAVHQFRVSIRSLRSIMSFIKSYLDIEKYEAYQNILREMAQRFLYIRQYDVIIKEWEAIIEENVEYLGQRKVFLQVLKKERLKEQDIAFKWIINEDISHGLSEILSWIWSFDDGLDTDETEDYFDRRLEKILNRVNKGMITVDYSKLEEVHSLRIQCKKARYVLENLQQTNKNIKLSKKYKVLQDDLGLICDTMVNKSFLDKLIENNKIDGIEYEVGIFIGYQMNHASSVIKRLM